MEPSGKPILARPLPPIVATPLIDVRNAMAEVLGAYLLAQTFPVWGGDAAPTETRLAEVLPVWPDAQEEIAYPSASIIEIDRTLHDPSNFVPVALHDTLGVFDAMVPGYSRPDCNDPKSVLWKSGEASVTFQVDFWANEQATREAIAAKLPAVFNPDEARTGVMLEGHPRFFSRRVRATLLSTVRQDSDTQVFARERRLRCRIRCESDIVTLRRATLSTPIAFATVTDTES